MPQGVLHPRKPRGSQSGREKRRDESFQVREKEPLGTHSHRTISKNSSGCQLLIGHSNCFVLLCPIGEQTDCPWVSEDGVLNQQILIHRCLLYEESMECGPPCHISGCKKVQFYYLRLVYLYRLKST